MAVINPVKIVVENYPENQVEDLVAPNHPKDETMGTRTVPFSREIYIDLDDFRETANRKYKRLVLGDEVRLRYGYVIKAKEAIKDSDGNLVEIRCTFDPETLGKNPDGRKVRGVIHWVSATRSHEAEIRMYDRLFTVNFPDAVDEDFHELLNPESLTTCHGRVEESLIDADPSQRYQFEREGYYCADARDSRREDLVFNQIVGLRDTWAKIEQKEESV